MLVTPDSLTPASIMQQRKRALTGFPNLAQARHDLSTRLGPSPLYPVGATRRLRFGIPPPPWVPLGVYVSCHSVWYNPPPHFDFMMLDSRPPPLPSPLSGFFLSLSIGGLTFRFAKVPSLPSFGLFALRRFPPLPLPRLTRSAPTGGVLSYLWESASEPFGGKRNGQIG